MVGWYAEGTFSSSVLVIGGASSPQPSLSTLRLFVGPCLVLEPARGLKAAAPALLRVGVKAGFEEMGGGGAFAVPADDPPPYLEPEASETFWIIDSGVRSRSDRAVICT